MPDIIHLPVHEASSNVTSRPRKACPGENFRPYDVQGMARPLGLGIGLKGVAPHSRSSILAAMRAEKILMLGGLRHRGGAVSTRTSSAAE